MKTLIAGACRLTSLAALGAALALPLGAAQAAPDYPAKPVRIVVPNPAGGASDVVARLIAQKLGDEWGQPVVVENRAGANGNIGAMLVAKAEPDGHTLLLMDQGSLAISPSLYTLQYSPTRDLAPVSIVAYSPHILVVRKDLPVSNVEELVAYAKANPGKLNLGVTPGAITHLAGVLMAQRKAFTWNYVGYKGGSQVLSDLAGGQIDAAINSFLATYPLVKSGNIKLVGVASPERYAPIPDTPTLAESVPGFVTGSWQGLLAPAGTPPDIVAKIHADIARIVARPDVRARLAELGSEPVEKTPAEFADWLREQTDYWAKVVRDNAIKLE